MCGPIDLTLLSANSETTWKMMGTGLIKLRPPSRLAIGRTPTAEGWMEPEGVAWWLLPLYGRGRSPYR